MVCEFLPPEFKKKLLDIATVDDLVSVGFSKHSAYNTKREGIISDERCEKLLQVLGKSAFPVLQEAFQSFAEGLRSLGVPLQNASLRNLLDEYFKRYFEAYFGKPKTEADLDRIYEQVKDRLGMTTIEILRVQMGMTLEQFLARFRDHIIQNYELFPGGKEGIVLNGVVHGVIRRRT